MLPDFGLCEEPPSCRTGLALTNTMFLTFSGYDSAWFSKFLLVLPEPEDLPDFHPVWHGRLDAHGYESSLLDTTASLEVFHPLVLPVFVWSRTVALPLLRNPLSCRTVCLPECLFSLTGPEDLVCKTVSWKRGLLATRVGEASHPGPAATSAESAQHSDILGAALQEAHPPVFQVSHDQVPYVPESVSRASLIGSAPSPPPPPGSVATSLRRPAPQDSAQAPSSKRHASSNGRWYCLVPSCPDHCPHSSRGWASFCAMKGHQEQKRLRRRRALWCWITLQ